MKYKILFVLTSCLLLACGQQPPSPEASSEEVVLVTVDGRPVTLPMLERVMEARGIGEEDHERMREALDELIRMQVVANAARAEGLDAAPDVRAELRLTEMQTLYRHYINRAQQARPVTDDDVSEVYEAQRARSGDTQYRIEFIAYQDQARALRAIARIDSGEADFESLQEEAEAGGLSVDEPGWIDRSQIPQDFAAALAQAAAGEVVAQPLESPRGWHLVRVVETRELQAPPLDQVREGIARSLLQRQREDLIQSLYDQAEITPMLPLEASGPEPEE